MRIQHNIAALNSYRNLTNNNSAVAKNLEKLSSGYRINRAGDDAAGLAISEKMRAQITGLKTAQKNANDGISLVQTAEGALTEVHSMLNRMVELANQSANGTYADAPDRNNLQAEIDSLKEEIDRISQATNFNGINLLDGSLGLNKDTFEIGASTEEKAAKSVNGKDLGITALEHASSSIEEQQPAFSIDLADWSGTIAKNTTTADSADFTLKIGGTAATITSDVPANGAAMSGATAATVKVDGSTTADTDVTASDIANAFKDNYAKIGNDIYKLGSDGTKITFTYKGCVDGSGNYHDETSDEGRVSANTWVPTGKVEVENANGNLTGTANRIDCNIINITDPVAGADPQRTGFKLKITDEIINSGSLKIGDTTFKFDKTVAPGGGTPGTGEVIIGLKDVADANLVQSVTEQMSSATVKLKNADDAEFTFSIGRVTGSGASGSAKFDTLEFEEAVPQAPTGGGDPVYGNFTVADVQKQITQSRGHENATSSVTLKGVPKLGDSIKIGDNTYTFGVASDPTNKIVGVELGSDESTAAANLAKAIGSSAAANGAKVTITAQPGAKAATIGSSGLMLQIGDTSDIYNRMTVDVKDMSTDALGIDGIDISTQGGAQAAVDKIKAAIDKVSSQRGDLGAIQNRLEHTINNLSVTAENMTAAESRIRDVDMAEEMMAYTKNNILVQAAQAMLAQANQVPQGVLQLLQ